MRSHQPGPEIFRIRHFFRRLKSVVNSGICRQKSILFDNEHAIPMMKTSFFALELLIS